MDRRCPGQHIQDDSLFVTKKNLDDHPKPTYGFPKLPKSIPLSDTLGARRSGPSTPDRPRKTPQNLVRYEGFAPPRGSKDPKEDTDHVTRCIPEGNLTPKPSTPDRPKKIPENPVKYEGFAPPRTPHTKDLQHHDGKNIANAIAHSASK